MKTLFVMTAMTVALVACGGQAEAPAATPEASAALQSQLPTLSGPYVWDMNEGESHLTFEAFYNGQLTGQFTTFQTAISLNPDAPEEGEIHAVIDLASVASKNEEATANLPSKDWFNTAAHPYATFSSTQITSLGDDTYKADGSLTLKNISKPVALVFSLTTTENSASASGELEISRRDFNVGEGPDFITEDWVKFPVKINMDIKATR